MEKQKAAPYKPVSNEDLARGVQRLAAVYAVSLASLAFVLGSAFGQGKAKEVYRGVESYLASGKENERQSVAPRCSAATQEVTVRPGDNQWSLEQRHVKGVNLVLRDALGTVTVEKHPGDGILEPGDSVIMPVRCWRQVTPQN